MDTNPTASTPARPSRLGGWLLALAPLGAVAAVDLFLRHRDFAGSAWTKIAIYPASVIYEGLIILLAARLLARLKPRRPWLVAGILAAVAAAYAFAAFGSWGYYRYFHSLPGMFAFFFLLQEPENFGTILGSGLSWQAVLGLAVISAAFFAFLHAGTARLAAARLEPSGRRWPGRLALVALALALTSVLNNNIRIASGYALPASDGIFSLIQAVRFHLGGKNTFVRFQKRPVHEMPPALDREAPFNGVFILNESLRARNMSAYGYARPTTPQLDRYLAARPGSAYLFTSAFTNSTVTQVSVPMVFTGRNPVDGWDRLMSSYTVYEELKRFRNMKTALLASHSYHMSNYKEFFSSPALDDYFYRELENLPKYCDIGADDRVVTERFARFLDSLGKGDSFFAILHLNATHHPYVSPPEYSPFPRKSLADDYDNSIVYADKNMADILRVLEERNLAPKTWVWISSDHGEDVETEGDMGHFGHFSWAKTRVPFILILPPGVAAPESAAAAALRSNLGRIVGNQDIVPTMLDLYGVPYDEGSFIGRSLIRPLPDDRPFFIYNMLQGSPDYMVLFWKGNYWLVEQRKDGGFDPRLFRFTPDGPAGPDLWPSLPESEKASYLKLIGRYPALDLFSKGLVVEKGRM